MPNERFRAALNAARLDRESVAHALRVDARTVERWEVGRVPHPRHRLALAELLGQSEGHLWPGVAPPGRNGAAELLGVYSHRADLEPSVWRDLFATATQHIDLLGFALLFLPEQHPGLTSLLASKGDSGCSVRIVLADPGCEAVRDRDAEEKLNGALPKRIATTLHYFRELTISPGVEIRLQTAPMYNSIFRFDEEMIVTPHLHGRPGYNAPALHLRRAGPDGVFSGFHSHFESIWSTAVPVGEAHSASH